ncbi:LysE family translocator [Sulfitobacter sp. S190]|uniref:LysE family translocator n=1 Tax=Sulfitobacter sp. S190 TaxID=2867022 RepID=UPI0021A2F2CC|nr:LysE family transporter [Sulfitobacter sp. S190]UWR23773.1 LysE family transporter [Sulfitobacter sp. S190]
MTPEHLIAFNAVLIAAILSPGAAFLMAVRTSVASGRRAGILTGLGLGLAASFWTLAALLGLEGVFTLFPWTYTTLKLGGALYLIYLGIKTWRGANAPLTADAKPARRAFVEGLLVNAANPKSMLFAAAVIVVVFPEPLSARDIALVWANHLALEIAFYTLCALLLSAPVARGQYLRLKPLLDRFAAALLGGFGLKLLLQR